MAIEHSGDATHLAWIGRGYTIIHCQGGPREGCTKPTAARLMRGNTRLIYLCEEHAKEMSQSNGLKFMNEQPGAEQ